MAQVNAPQAASWRLAHTCRSPALRSLGLLGRSCIVPARVVLARRPSRHFGHEIIQAQNAVQLKATGEGGSQPYSLSLRTADPLTAIGLVHRSLVTEAQNSRRGTANTLTRSEVQGGGKKPYAQKGTGNARIGSRRTPLRPGGGVSFGPKATDWSIKINKKERRLAVATALQNAAADILVVESIREGVALPKTSMLAALLGRWGIRQEQCVLLIVEELTSNLVLASRNLPGVILTTADRLVLSEILRAGDIVIEAGALAYIQDVDGQHPFAGRMRIVIARLSS